MESAIITFTIDPPRMETRAMARRISGKAIIASISRDMGASRRRKNPATRPIAMPLTLDKAATPSPMVSDAWPAISRREATSRPNASAPSQYSAPGSVRRARTDILNGSAGEMTAASRHMAAMITKIISAISTLRRAKRTSGKLALSTEIAAISRAPFQYFTRLSTSRYKRSVARLIRT